ncbi:cellulase family glycosylhydrolase [Paenibacillus lemnae]|uniref:Cellulase family glycosylhydrolase n=2 Tax=Paenibacillus lemnae TaxID=1330551 RepID=A0A848M2X5_PAELE|nr:cellulase family glycosylhydrolase [Paenibacillus lemnae]
MVSLSALAVVLIVGALIVSSWLSAQPTEELDIQAYVEDMQPGWNLGNTFDATGGETSWGNPATTRELIHHIAGQGFKSIRIPVTWDHRVGNAPDYLIDPVFLDRIEEVVDWSLDEGLYVMINLHHDSGEWIKHMESNHDEVMARYQALWTQISGHFKNHSSKLMFESINEPRFDEDWNRDQPQYFTMLEELNTSFHQIVRRSGGNNTMRPLVIPGITASASQARLDALYDNIKKLNDNKLIATIHYYGYYPFSVNLGSTTFDDTVRRDVTETFDRTYKRFEADGIPVIVGEYGLLGFDKFLGTIQQGEKLKYFEFVNHYANEKRFTMMLWDNGQHLDRRGLKWADEDLYAVIKAGFKGRSANAETDNIFIRKDEKIQDSLINLHLNGSRFQSLNLDGAALKEGKDYALEGSMLTIKAELLQRVQQDSYGEQAVLTAKFSSGADWKFHIISYDPPELQQAPGSIEELLIPTEFNGDVLATMKAMYSDGRHAGPSDWTSYKEFGHCFVPLYETQKIKLTRAFLDELEEGTVQLKFHFWSGEIMEYLITKEGTSITGSLPNVENR